jgi:hypothetical protein
VYWLILLRLQVTKLLPSLSLSTQRHPAFRNSPLQKLQQPILKLRRCPHSVAATSQLCLLSRKSLSSIETRFAARAHSLLPSSLYVERSHCPRSHASYLAALTSTRAISQTRVFYVSHPIRSIRRCNGKRTNVRDSSRRSWRASIVALFKR